MVHFSPKEISERENYKFLIGSIIPRTIALITSLCEDEVVNIVPFSYFIVVRSNPPIVSVAVQRKQGEMKDTTRNLLANKEGVIHVVDNENVDDANETAANLTAEESELDETNFTLIPSKTVKTPRLKETKIRFEVELYDHVFI